MSTIAVGTEIVPVARPDQGFEHWNRYAAVNDEFVGIHMFDEAGKQAGYPSAFGMGNILTSYIHIMLREWIGESGRIASVSMQFRSPLLRGLDVTARGVVTGTRENGDEMLIDLDVWTEAVMGDGEVRKLSPGTAAVALPLGDVEKVGANR